MEDDYSLDLTRSGDLRVDATPFLPSERMKPIKTVISQRDVLATLDKVPFTPSQGVCTPSPTHTWIAHHPPTIVDGRNGAPWASQGQEQPAQCQQSQQHYGSPGSNASDASMFPASKTSGSSGTASPLTRPLVQSLFYPLPGSPRASIQDHAGGLEQGWEPLGSPSGRSMFAQFFAGELDAEGEAPLLSDEGVLSPGGKDAQGRDGAGAIEVTPAAYGLAASLCTAQGLAEPPMQLVELASLLMSYGLAVGASGPPSPVQEGRGRVKRTKTQPLRLNADGSIRLNARQRRTLRRAQERALRSLVDAQRLVHGGSLTQAASRVFQAEGLTYPSQAKPPLAPPPTLQVPYTASTTVFTAGGYQGYAPGMGALGGGHFVDASGYLPAGYHPPLHAPGGYCGVQARGAPPQVGPPQMASWGPPPAMAQHAPLLLAGSLGQPQGHVARSCSMRPGQRISRFAPDQV
ncbi:hypothetical protein ACKKBG_A22610 [Auxenochlorella protothecoides x Auxenochlorella symbiontica]